MPNLSYDTSFLKAPASEGQSLGDLVNLARGAQQYSKEKELYESDIQKAKAESEKSKFGLQGDKYKAAIEIAGALATNPIITQAQDPRQMTQEFSRTFFDLKQRGFSDEEALSAVSPFMALVGKDPKAVAPALQNLVRQGIGSTGQGALQTPSLVQTPSGPALYTSGTGTLSGANLPGQGQPAGQPMGVQQGQMGMPADQQQLRLQYPVRQAGQPYAALPSEEDDRKVGSSYRTGLVARQNELPQSRRNIQEVIKTAEELAQSNFPTTGVLGATRRTVGGWLGDPTYKQLSKDLANVQISNIKATGGSLDTVGGQQLVKMANGDETYPPEVLIHIARRADADTTNIDMQATAAQKFAEKYGDQNSKAFQQLWNKNADSKIFEVMNLYRDKGNSPEVKAEVDKLLGTDPVKRKEFFQKYQNIQKLYNSGAL